MGRDRAKLTDIDETYAPYLEAQKAAMARVYTATILVRAGVAEKVFEKYQKTELTWQQAAKTPRDPRLVARRIRDVVPLAAARSFDCIHEVEDNYFTKQG